MHEDGKDISKVIELSDSEICNDREELIKIAMKHSYFYGNFDMVFGHEVEMTIFIHWFHCLC